jgi:protein gp37
MGDATKIEWTDATWNPIRGCSRVSPGCDNCYAIGMAHRFSWGEGLTTIRKGRPDWTGKIRIIEDKLEDPLAWGKPCRVFVCSGADLFHHDVPFDLIAALFGVMAATPRHTYQILTKRPDRMAQFFAWIDDDDGWPRLRACWQALRHEAMHHPDEDGGPLHTKLAADPTGPWPLPNVWIGASVEDQPRARRRIMLLAECPAAVHYLSCEPLLGEIDLTGIAGVEEIDWVIAGAESGPGARPMNEDWVRSLRDQCCDAEVPFFYKQRIEGGRKVSLPELDGRVWAEFPEVPCAG